jgi:quercetin dioxygenase-like cupin family protein
MQTVEPGGRTPAHYHDCEKIIDTIKGAGQLSIEEKIIEFGPDHTLLIPLFSINSSIMEV